MPNKSKKSNVVQDSSKIMLDLFVGFLIVSLFYILYLGFLDFRFLTSNFEFNLFFYSFVLSISVLLTIFHIDVILLTIKRKSTTVFAAKALFFVLIITSLGRIMGILIFKEGYEVIITEGIWIFFYVVFIIFLKTSLTVKKEFPKKIRKSRFFEFLLTILILLLFILSNFF